MHQSEPCSSLSSVACVPRAESLVTFMCMLKCSYSASSCSALYSSFITPWSDNNIVASLQVEPDFHLPSCYNVQPPPPAQSKIASFTDETLFFIFYSTPRDVLQEVAAQEL